jgi:hypothetical protein
LANPLGIWKPAPVVSQIVYATVDEYVVSVMSRGMADAELSESISDVPAMHSWSTNRARA